jgi:ABC-type transport system involved in multi-copper enzyme maturation permease subunit
MEFVFIIICVLFIALAFILTENNAKYLLAGYNTMSPEERKKVDIKGLIAYFKRFFIFLGVSLMIVGLTAGYYLSEKNTALIFSFYIIIACIYLVISSQKFYKK